MTDNERTPDFFADLMQPWIAQLRMITDTLAGMTTRSQSDTPQLLRSLQGLSLPGTLSAAQLDSFARGVAAQRSSIAALQNQLTVFDDQLATMETMIGPLAEWSKAWAEFERVVMNPGPGRGPEH